MKVLNIFKKFKTEIMVFVILMGRMLYNNNQMAYQPKEYAAFALMYLFIAFVAGRFVARFDKESKIPAELFAALMSLSYCVTFENSAYRQHTLSETGTVIDMGLHFTAILFFACFACLCVSRLAWLSVILCAGALVIDLSFAAMYMPVLIAAAFISCSDDGIDLRAGKQAYENKNRRKSPDRFVAWVLLAMLAAVAVYYFAIDIDVYASNYWYDKFFLGDKGVIVGDTYIKDNYLMFLIPVASVGALLPAWWSKLKGKSGKAKAVVGFAAFIITCFNAYLFDFGATHPSYYCTSAVMGAFLAVMVAVVRKDDDFQKSITQFFSKYGYYFVSAAAILLLVLGLINNRDIGGY